MDFAFVPGSNLHARLVRRLMNNRSQTTLIAAKRGRTTVRQFIRHLNSAASIAKPIGNLLLGSHANSEGQILIALFAGAASATYATLEDSLSDPAKSIAIPDTLIGYTPDPPTTFVHYKGCNAGKSRPFLVKFKEALGDHVNMTAPRHFHDVFFDTRFGVWESMAYEFILRLPDPRDRTHPQLPLADRAAVLAAFIAEKFDLVDGTRVPDTNWDTVIGSGVRSGTKWLPTTIDRTTTWYVRAKLATPVGSRTTANTKHEFRVDPSTFEVVITSTSTTPANREQDLRADLAARARFQPAHAFPIYEELGYTSLTNFMNGYHWKFTPAGGTDLRCVGSRVSYTSVIPILDPADALNGALIANFYPRAGSPHPANLTALVESNPRFFESV